MVDAALRAAGHRTGRYTSPHLVRLEERFAIDGRAVTRPRSTRRSARSATPSRRCAPRRARGAPDVLRGHYRGGVRDLPRVPASTSRCSKSASAAASMRPTSSSRSSPRSRPSSFDHEQHLGDDAGGDRRSRRPASSSRGIPVVVGSLPAEAARVVRRPRRDATPRCTSAGECVADRRRADGDAPSRSRRRDAATAR